MSRAKLTPEEIRAIIAQIKSDPKTEKFNTFEELKQRIKELEKEQEETEIN
jgi:hypothetical protein